MPAIWSSSERPISVRTVWVDGVRHAVLSKDDPVLHADTSRRSSKVSIVKKSVPEKYEACSSILDSLNNCFVKLRVKVGKSRDEKRRKRVIQRQSAPCSRSSYHHYRLINSSYRQTVKTPIDLEDSGTDSVDSAKSGDIEDDDMLNLSEDLHLNLLSDRVIQWLDLSGKVGDYEKDFIRLEENSCNQFFRSKKYSKIERVTSNKKHGAEEIDKKSLLGELEYVKQTNVSQKWCILSDDSKSSGRFELHIFMPSLVNESYESLESLDESRESSICE